MGFFHPCGSVLSVSGLGSEALAFFYLRTLSEEDCSGSVFNENVSVPVSICLQDSSVFPLSFPQTQILNILWEKSDRQGFS